MKLIIILLLLVLAVSVHSQNKPQKHNPVGVISIGTDPFVIHLSDSSVWLPANDPGRKHIIDSLFDIGRQKILTLCKERGHVYHSVRFYVAGPADYDILDTKDSTWEIMRENTDLYRCSRCNKDSSSTYVTKHLIWVRKISNQ